MTLTEFLLARIAEDEERAKRAAFGWGREWTAETCSAEDWVAVHADDKRDMVGCEDGDVTEHIAHHDPARVLADCEAKRQIVKEYLAHVRHYESREADGWPADAVRRDARVSGRAVEMLAAIYADHPDYREEWKP